MKKVFGNEMCDGCKQIKMNCICNDPPIVAEEKKKLYAIDTFLSFFDLTRSNDKKIVEISVKFEHRRFKDSTNRLFLKMSGVHMEDLADEYIKSVQKKRREIAERIKKYEENH